MMKKLFLLLFTLACTLTPSFGVQQHFLIDPSHSHIVFRVRHFISKIAGSFEKFEGDIYYDSETVSNSKTTLKVYTNSVDTNNKERDTQLKTEDFLFVESYPNLEFESVSWLQKDINTFEVFGYLTMLGKKLPLTINLELIDMTTDSSERVISGWQGSGKFDRSDWGMRYGIPAMGSEVEFDFQVQAITR